MIFTRLKRPVSFSKRQGASWVLLLQDVVHHVWPLTLVVLSFSISGKAFDVCYYTYDDGRDGIKTQRLKRLDKGRHGEKCKQKTQSFSHLLQALNPKKESSSAPSSCGNGNYTVFQHTSTLQDLLFSQHSQGGGQEAEISENSPWRTAFRCSGSALNHVNTEHH